MSDYIILFALLTAGTGILSAIRSIIIIDHILTLQKERDENL